MSDRNSKKANEKLKDQLTPVKAHILRQFLVNEMMSRSAFINMTGDHNGLRDLDAECGWIVGEPQIEDYKNLYDREGVAERVVNVYPEESWSVYPELYEKEEQGPTGTIFERAFREFEFEHDPWHYLYRTDVISGIGQYGVLLIGLAGQSDLSKPVPGMNEQTGERDDKSNEIQHKVIYLRPFSQDMVTIGDLDTDKSSPRYNHPKTYKLKIAASDQSTSMLTVGTVTTEITVHWHRIFHVAEECISHPWLSKPRMRPVINRLKDIRKILGGSAEMFWQGAFPGYSLETLPGWEDADFDTESARDEVEAYRNGLQRFMQFKGFTVKSLSPQAIDPGNHLAAQYNYICATIQTPTEIFFGSQIGVAAGESNIELWNRRLKGRQDKYLTRQLCFRFFRRLQHMRVLPWTDRLVLKWKDFNYLTQKEKADVMVKKAQTLLQYVTSGAETIMPVREFLTMVFDLSDDEATALLKAAKENKEPVTKELWDPMAGLQEGANLKKDASKKTGMAGRTNSQ